MRLLITGGAGFIGSNLVEYLLEQNTFEAITVLDNLSNGALENLRPYLDHPQLSFVKGDIRDFGLMKALCQEHQLVCHQAALGSVPRSIKDPLNTNAHNIEGTLNVFKAAHEAGIKRVVYASSSSVYGDEPNLPKYEDRVGQPLSPYAITKKVNELYAQVMGSIYGMEFIGLRYFNIFGPNQSPEGPYAAVIPLFMRAALKGEAPTINGDGSNSRDFTYVDNAVQANVKALTTQNPQALNQVYNIACGDRIDLKELWQAIAQAAECRVAPNFGPPRAGDIPHSLADIGKAQTLLGYDPQVKVAEGIKKCLPYYRKLFA